MEIPQDVRASYPSQGGAGGGAGPYAPGSSPGLSSSGSVNAYAPGHEQEYDAAAPVSSISCHPCMAPLHAFASRESRILGAGLWVEAHPNDSFRYATGRPSPSGRDGMDSG